MFGKKNKPTIDLQDDKERQARELAALEASLDFLKRPAKPAEDEAADGEDAVKEVTAADRARAQKFGRRMDYKTAVVKRGSNSDSEDAESSASEETAQEAAVSTKESAPAEETVNVEAAPAEPAASEEVSEKTEDAVTEPAEEETTVSVSEPAEEKTETSAGPEESASTAEDTASEEETKSGLIIAEAPVPDTGEEAPKLIENPLPTPKKHVPREMDFDIEPDADHMHFDVVDMKGKDYFDIN